MMYSKKEVGLEYAVFRLVPAPVQLFRTDLQLIVFRSTCSRKAVE